MSDYSATKIDGITDPKHVAYGSGFTCVLNNSGGVKCFGINSYGQLGDGSTTTSTYDAVQVTGLTSGVDKIGVGYRHACACRGQGCKGQG